MAITPIVDRSRRFTHFKMDEIYTGPTGTGRWVPNVDDMVTDWEQGFYRVVAVDHERTNLSYLQKINFNTMGGGMDDSDYAVVTGVGSNSNSFRIYVDTKTVPHTLAVDSRTTFYGDNAYIKVFKGTDTSAATGKVISAIINSNGKVVSENIPLVLTTVPNGTNVNEKTPQTAWCSETVKDGDVVTVVTYTNAGQITSRDKFIISESNLIRSLDQAGVYVNNIELLSPFLSKTDARLIECPINLLASSLNFQAKVTYSDNKSRVDLIDGLKWNIAGLDMFISSQIGKMDRVLLTYKLAPEELAFDASAALPERIVRREYRIKTIDIDTYYAVKLFAVPVWNATSALYSLKWYLYNLERSDIIDVTNFVEYATTSPKFVGNKYTGSQKLLVSFNLQHLGASYSYYVHTQVVVVDLKAPGSTKAAAQYYTIAYADDLLYGERVRGLYATDEVNAGKFKLDISCGYTDPASWLNANYRTLAPLNYDKVEITAPNPTHARVVIGTDAWVREIPIEEITNPIRNINVTMSQGVSVRVELFRRESGKDSRLATAPILASAML